MDIYKLTRRFCSIFGNYSPGIIKMLYQRSYEALKSNDLYGNDEYLKEKIYKLFEDTLSKSISRVMGKKLNLVIKHASENTFSAADLSKFIDRLQVEKLKVKIAFVDYVDTMTPSVKFAGMGNDYDIHGLIVQELRNCSRQHKIPIITATQMKRGAENPNMMLTNSDIGDSIKKLRFSDFLYLFRQDCTKNVFDSDLKTSVMSNDMLDKSGNVVPEVKKLYDDITDDTIPLTMKISKSKDSKRDEIKYLIFAKSNLRIYNSLKEYLSDMRDLHINSNQLEKEINALVNDSISTISNDFEDDLVDDELICAFDQVDL